MDAVGSLGYMAPELLLRTWGGRFTDWWAVGVLAHELLTGCSPWSTLEDQRQLAQEIATVQPPLPSAEEFGISGEAGHFVRGLLDRDVALRLGSGSSAEVRFDAFFNRETEGGDGGPVGGIDWRRAEAGALGPVLPPLPAKSLEPEASAAALEAYAAILDAHRPAAGTGKPRAAAWSLGIEQAATPPKFHRGAVMD
jgi:serine/threonine protein kinase